MSYISNRVKSTFVKIFKNLAKELNTMPELLMLGIEYNSDGATYTVYKDLMKLKQAVPDGNGGIISIDKKIDIQEYTGGNLISVGGGAIEATINQFGAQQAYNLGCNISDVDVILQYDGENNFPKAALRKKEGEKFKKVKNIDILNDIIAQ